MILKEKQIRRVVRKTISENFDRVDERFYVILERNLIHEGIFSSIKDFSKKNGVGIAKTLTLFAALSALAPQTQSNQYSNHLSDVASEISMSDYNISIDDMSDLEDIIAGKMDLRVAKNVLDNIEDTEVASNLCNQADILGIQIDATVSDLMDDGGTADILATAIGDNISYDEAKFQVDTGNL